MTTEIRQLFEKRMKEEGWESILDVIENNKDKRRAAALIEGWIDDLQPELIEEGRSENYES